jgi:uncharacterized protein with von Willebrand factor type A (vWA) domain
LRAGADDPAGRLRHVVLAPARRLPAEASADPDPSRRDLRARPAPRDEREIARELRRTIESLRLRSSRRRRRAPRGRPALRRVFRDSQRTGGLPFVLPRERRRTRTPRIVLLVDVSWSTVRAAGLFLAIAGEFVELGRQARVFLFVDRPVEATDAVRRWQRAGTRRAFADVVASVPELNLQAASDYGRTFHGLLGAPGRPRGRRTVLVVLGDARTNRLDPLSWAFDDLASRCGAVLWLVPEPLARWGTGDSALDTYLPHVDTVVEARDLAGLARGVAELVRRMR